MDTLNKDAATHTMHKTFAAFVAACRTGNTPSLRRSRAGQRRLGEALALRGLPVHWE